MSLPTMSLGDRFFVRRKDDMGGEGRWVHPKGETAWPCLAGAGR